MDYLLVIWSDDYGCWAAHSIYDTYEEAYIAGYSLFGPEDTNWDVR